MCKGYVYLISFPYHLMEAEWHLKKLLFFSLIKSAQMYNKNFFVELLSSPTIGCTPWERSSSYHFIPHLDPFVGLIAHLNPIAIVGMTWLDFPWSTKLAHSLGYRFHKMDEMEGYDSKVFCFHYQFALAHSWTWKVWTFAFVAVETIFV